MGTPQPPLLNSRGKSLASNLMKRQEMLRSHPVRKPKEGENNLLELKRLAQMKKQMHMKRKWEETNKITEKASSCSTPQVNPAEKEAQTSYQQPPQPQPFPKYAKPSSMKTPFQTHKSGITAENLEDGLVLKTRIRTSAQQNDRDILYEDGRFSKMHEDIKEILDRDTVEVDMSCIHYLREHVHFNSNNDLGVNVIQFEGVNRYAKFEEVFCSFLHILDLCKDDHLNDIMDNLITVTLSSRSFLIILCTVLGRNTLTHLLHVNRDLADSAKLLSMLDKKIDIDETFND